jgi:putative sugar O-methyltransferase
MVNIDYSPYTRYVQTILETQDLGSFKTNPNYTYMLEHVNETQGKEYLNLIQSKTSISAEQIKTFCESNDRLGNPNKATFDGFVASPTSLRYIWHAHTILSWFATFEESKKGLHIVEVGGGYGGLCLAISFFAEQYGVHIASYTIVDIKEPSALQSLYLSKHTLTFPVTFEDATTYGRRIDRVGLFLISNYCFSEISAENQKAYMETLFPKVSHGFIAWNMIPTYHFGFDMRIEEETPNTGPFNKFVFF